MDPPPKRPRSEFDDSAQNPAFRHPPTDGRDTGQPSSLSTSKPKPCLKFFSTSGCPFGEFCHFLHYVPGGTSSLGLGSVASLSSASAVVASQRKYAGPAGDPSVTINGYKTKLCNKFNTAEGCRFGDKCHFAHGESDLRPPNNLSRGNRRPMPNGPPLVAAPTAINIAPPGYPNLAGYPPPSTNAPNFPL